MIPGNTAFHSHIKLAPTINAQLGRVVQCAAVSGFLPSIILDSAPGVSMATRKVVYDDQDSNTIRYSGDWFATTSAEENIGNFGTPYLHTLHGTNHDASISFEFDGTGIEVYGTSILSNPKTNPDPTLECFVDGVSIGRERPFEFPENNWKLCGSSGYPAGTHKLQIDIKVQSPNQTFWLDQIRYTPSPSVPWVTLASFKSTSKSNAVAHVDFIGTSVSWVGYIPVELPHGSATGTYAIDDGKPVNFNLAGLAEAAGESVYNQVFFTTPDVENGHHTLTVTFFGSGSTTPLTLDHLYIKNGTLLAASLSKPGNSPANASVSSLQPNLVVDSSIITSANTVTATSIHTITNANTLTSLGAIGNSGGPSPPSSAKTVPSSGSESANDGGKSGLNIGALLGGILGGLGLFILIAAALLYCRRRRRRLHLSKGKMVQPFKGEPGVSSLDGMPLSKVTAQATYGIAPLLTNRVSAKQREAIPVETRPIRRSHGGSDTARLSAQQPIISSTTEEHPGRVHTDSGVRLNQPLVEDIPPHYTLD